MTKAALRRALRARRTAFVTALAPADRIELEQALNRQLLPCLHGTVASYAAFGDEIDPGRAFGALPVVLPRILPGGRLDFALPTLLVRHRMGIDEPAAASPAVDPDVVLVPLLAVDAHGYRLGYGGGYYDRTLASLRARRSIVAIGCAWPIQRVERLPRDIWDARLDAVATPDGVLRL